MGILHKLLQDILTNQLYLSFIRHPKSRVKTDLVKMVSKYKKTEAVNGGDLGVM